MNKDYILEIRSKLVTPTIALEKLSKDETVPESFISLSCMEIKKAVELLEKCDMWFNDL